MEKIILASQSPRRKQILEWAEIPFEVIVKETDESFPSELIAEDAAMHIAKNKALAVKKYLDDFATILSADTMVVIDNKIMGKPVDRDDAIRILHKLSGRTHFVITGVCILHNKKEILFADKTEVEFHLLTMDQIEYYIDKYKLWD